MVKGAVKPTKVKKVSKAKVPAINDTSSSSTVAPLAQPSLFECSPPLQRNGAKQAKAYLLSNDEQKLYTKHSSEVKQITALLILKSGLCLAESPVMSQILQEDFLLRNYEKVYKQLSQDAIIGKRVSAIPFKFLNIATSKAVDVMSGLNIRKKYSTHKGYINNTLSVLWRR